MSKRLNNSERVALMVLFGTAAMTAMHKHLSGLERRGYVTRGPNRVEEYAGDADGDGAFILNYPQYEITAAGRKVIMHWRQMRSRAGFVVLFVGMPIATARGTPLWP